MPESLFSKAGLSLERLQTFSEIVKAHGISTAAPGDSNRQSQFSRQLKELEEFFGAELIRRSRGHFEVTSAGMELFAIIQAHFNALEELIHRCSTKQVEIRLGAGESLLQWLLMPTLPAIQSKAGNLTLVLSNLKTDTVVEQLLDGRLDFGVIRGNAIRPPLECSAIGTLQYCLVTQRSGVRSPKRKKGPWHVLQEQPVALLDGGGVTTALEDECKQQGIDLRVWIRGTSFLQIAEAVRRLGCAAVLPKLALKEFGNRELTCFELTELESFTRPIALVWNPKFLILRPAGSSLVQILAECLCAEMSRD